MTTVQATSPDSGSRVGARRISRLLIAVLFIGAGLGHFLMPQRYVSLVPHVLPAPLLLVYISGVFQIAGGIGVLVPSVRRAAGVGLIALLIAIFPANVQMLADSIAAADARWWQIALVLRLPLQGALMYWIWRAVVKTSDVSAQTSVDVSREQTDI